MNKYLIFRDDSLGRFTIVGTFESTKTDNKTIYLELYSYMKSLHEKNKDKFFEYFFTGCDKDNYTKWNDYETAKVKIKIDEFEGVHYCNIIIHDHEFDLIPLDKYKSINSLFIQTNNQQ